MISSNLTLSVAESCTSGRIASLVTEVPGSSVYFRGGIVAYQDEIKHKVLCVDQINIQSFGAVSQPVVKQMAENCLIKFNSDFSIASSGYLGPESNNNKDLIGTVYIAISNLKETKIERFSLNGARNIIAEKASHKALELLLNELKK